MLPVPTDLTLTEPTLTLVPVSATLVPTLTVTTTRTLADVRVVELAELAVSYVTPLPLVIAITDPQLTTTDDEFIGRDRKGGASGAYGDEAGPFKGNTAGPAGNTALTGREGNFGQNAVAESRTRDDDKASAAGGVHTTGVNESRTPTTGATGTHGNHGVHDDETGEKKGIFEKIKDALH